MSLEDELGLDDDLDLEENLDLELTGELEADLVAQLRAEATGSDIIQERPDDDQAGDLLDDGIDHANLAEADFLSEPIEEEIMPEDLEQTSTSRVDLGQADVSIEEGSLAPELASPSTGSLTHEQNIERQIADELDSDDDEGSGEYDYEYEGLEDEEEYIEAEQATSLKGRVQDFFSGLGGSSEGESKTKIMEKATQIFKIGQGKTSTLQPASGGLKASLRDSTVSKVLQEKIPALAKVLNKNKSDEDATAPDQGPTYEELTQISETDLDLDGDANIELGKGKRQLKLTRKSLIYIFAGLFFAWFIYDEFMGGEEEFPDLPDPPKKERPTKTPVKDQVEQPVNQPTEQPVTQPVVDPTEQPIEDPIDQPTEQSVVDPVEQPIEKPTEKPIEQPIEDPLKPDKEPTEKPGSDVKDPTVDNVTKDKKAIDSALEDIRKREEEERKRLAEERRLEEQRKREEELRAAQEKENRAAQNGENGSNDGYTGEEQILPQDVIEPPATNEITKQLLQDLEVKLKEERREQEILEDVRPTSAPSYDNIGKGLVYNCIDEHWACVNDETYKQCRGNYNWNRQQEVDTECYPYAQLGNEIDCATVQQEKIDTISETNFCN